MSKESEHQVQEFKRQLELLQVQMERTRDNVEVLHHIVCQQEKILQDLRAQLGFIDTTTVEVEEEDINVVD
jgi:hypothetical protein